ncbi:50S ribosomal protein L11 [Spiroplasma endosymbiont of Seladonia tumulorum]|uniref:50S ribosomal protein L11 n=1 Tax=Spiroplasma endosymbiont of Seladonia tumulorum TaxID=3066321 RepID=UPI003BAE97CF
MVTLRLDHSENLIKRRKLLVARITRIAKLEFQAGQAKPGPELASLGINMPQFCTQFNDATKERMGDVVPVVITAFDDKTFKFELKTTPAAILLKKAAKIQKGSAKAKNEKVATISADEVRKIAEYKLVDLNANDVEAAMHIIEGTARNMGIVVEGMPSKKKKN